MERNAAFLFRRIGNADCCLEVTTGHKHFATRHDGDFFSVRRNGEFGDVGQLPGGVVVRLRVRVETDFDAFGFVASFVSVNAAVPRVRHQAVRRNGQVTNRVRFEFGNLLLASALGIHLPHVEAVGSVFGQIVKTIATKDRVVIAAFEVGELRVLSGFQIVNPNVASKRRHVMLTEFNLVGFLVAIDDLFSILAVTRFGRRDG